MHTVFECMHVCLHACMLQHYLHNYAPRQDSRVWVGPIVYVGVCTCLHVCGCFLKEGIILCAFVSSLVFAYVFEGVWVCMCVCRCMHLSNPRTEIVFKDMTDVLFTYLTSRLFALDQKYVLGIQ